MDQIILIKSFYDSIMLSWSNNIKLIKLVEPGWSKQFGEIRLIKLGVSVDWKKWGRFNEVDQIKLIKKSISNQIQKTRQLN